MTVTVLLNQTEINPYSFKKETAHNGAIKITMVFNVHSSDYHKITTLLYKQTFAVNVPGENLSFKGTIINYATSFTNLYEEGAAGDFHLELLEIQ